MLRRDSPPITAQNDGLALISDQLDYAPCQRYRRAGTNNSLGLPVERADAKRLARRLAAGSTIMTRVPDPIELRRHRGVRCLLAIMVGASVLFFFGASDIRSLMQAPPAAAKSRGSPPKDRGQAPAQPAPPRFAEVVGNSRRTAYPAWHLQQQRRPEMAERGTSLDRCRGAEREAPR